MSKPLVITGLSGSLRTGAYSTLLLDHIAGLLPDSSDYAAIDIGAIPHYDGDVEAAGLPDSVVAARARITASDAVLIVTPEFNHGLPGVLKNALDWLSRPAFTSCMADKPVFFATQAPGHLGGVRAQYQLRETLASMLCRLIAMPEIAITHIDTKVADGVVVDAETRRVLASRFGRFLAAIGQS